MFTKEAIWIGERIKRYCDHSGQIRILNVGSSTKKFREEEQPHIQSYIFDPINDLCEVYHLDLKPAEGVDIVGDLTDKAFLDRLKRDRFDVIICSNLLEHVSDPLAIASSLEDCINPGGHIVVTVPLVYPYHNDPIDTMYRPTPNELSQLFKRSCLIEEQIIKIDDTYLKVLFRKPKLLFLTILRCLMPFYKYPDWKNIVSGLRLVFQAFKVSCAVFSSSTD